MHVGRINVCTPSSFLCSQELTEQCFSIWIPSFILFITSWPFPTGQHQTDDSGFKKPLNRSKIKLLLFSCQPPPPCLLYLHVNAVELHHKTHTCVRAHTHTHTHLFPLSSQGQPCLMPLQEELSVGGINGDLWLWLPQQQLCQLTQLPFHCLLLALRLPRHFQPAWKRASWSSRTKEMEDGVILFLHICAWFPSSKGIKKIQLGETETVSVHGNNLLKPPHGTSPSTCRTVQLVYPMPEDSEGPVSRNSGSTCLRSETLRNSCGCIEATHGGGGVGVRSVLKFSHLCCY